MELSTIVDHDLNNLLETTKIKRKNSSRYVKQPHFLKSFFKSRNVTQNSLAKVLGIYQGDLSKMLNYKHLMFTEIENKLIQLMEKVLAWEERNNKRFGE